MEAFAWKKWDGEEGLDREWERREEVKRVRGEKKFTQQLKEYVLLPPIYLTLWLRYR